MIVTGKLYGDPEPLRVKITVDTSDFLHYIVEAARQVTLLDVLLEMAGLTVDQTWALHYQRGAFGPDFSDPDAFDNHLRVLGRVRGKRGHAARAGFVHGWAQHRAGGAS